MTNFKLDNNCPGAAWLNRKPESLVVHGYRGWLTGIVKSDREHWNTVWNDYAIALGPKNGRYALNAFEILVKTLGLCATCPLRFCPSASNHLCKDECLLLGLVAGLQHGDDETQRVCAESLSCKTKVNQVMAAAGDYALNLRIGGAVVTPIPANIIQEIVIDDFSDNPKWISKSFH